MHHTVAQRPMYLVVLHVCREVFTVDHSKHILHTMECTQAMPGVMPVAATQEDYQQLALEAMPSPTREAGASNMHIGLQQPDFAQDMPQTIPDLVVGPSRLNGDATALNVESNARVRGVVTAAGFNTISDQRVKNNIRPAKSSALASIDQISIYNYELKINTAGQQEIGILAQQLQEILPDAVEQDAENGLFRVKLDKLIMYTLKGVQEASQALKRLDAKQPLGMPLLMQSAHDSTHAIDDALPKNTTEHLTNSNSINDVNMSTEDATSSTQESGLASAPSAYSNFPNDKAMIQHIMAELGERNPGMPVKVGKLLQELGHHNVWEAFVQAQHTVMLAQDGKLLYLQDLHGCRLDK